MGDISTNFSRDEFSCNCGCGFDTVDAATVAIVQKIRDHFGRAVVINSGCRCPAYNARIGGAPHSQHVKARAADIAVAGVAPNRVADYAERLLGRTGGLGRYRTFTHVDTRTDGPARWDER